MVVTFEKARVGVTTLHLSRVARATNVIRKFWPLGLDFENNPLKGDYFFEVLTKLPTHLLRMVSESQAGPGPDQENCLDTFLADCTFTRYLLDTLHIYCTFSRRCGFCTSAILTPVRKLHRAANSSRCKNYTEPSQSAGRVARP